MALSQNENKEKMQRYALEEKHIREENLRLQRKLQQEVPVTSIIVFLRRSLRRQC